MICPNCGHEARGRFCTNCGARLDQQASGAPAGAQDAGATSVIRPSDVEAMAQREAAADAGSTQAFDPRQIPQSGAAPAGSSDPGTYGDSSSGPSGPSYYGGSQTGASDSTYYGGSQAAAPDSTYYGGSQADASGAGTYGGPSPDYGNYGSSPSAGSSVGSWASSWGSAVDAPVLTARPMRLGEIVSGTFDIVRARLRPFLQIAAAYTIAMWVALFIFGLIAVAAIGNLVTSGDIGSSIVGLVIGVLVLIAIGVVAATVAACAYINIARGAENVEGEDVIMGTIDAVRRSLRASPRLLLAMLVLAGLWVAFFIGLFLLTAIVGSVSGGLAALVYLAGIVVAVWLGVSFAFVPQAVVIDEAGPTQALSESMALVQGHWWRTLGYFLVAGLIALGIAIAGGIVSAIVGAITGHIPVVGGLIGALMQSAIFALMYAFYITYGTLMFYDLKARKSGVPEAAALTPGY